jgi:hypothetical protein
MFGTEVPRDVSPVVLEKLGIAISPDVMATGVNSFEQKDTSLHLESSSSRRKRYIESFQSTL